MNLNSESNYYVQKKITISYLSNVKERYWEDFETSEENNGHMCGQVLYLYIFYIPMKEC